MSVSVVVVNFRAYPEVADCLSSLYAHATADLEVVVIDHASDREAAARLAASFPRANIVTSDENPGFAAGVNKGVGMTHGTHVLLLNPDSVLNDDVCTALAAWLDNHPDVAVVGPRVMESDGTLQASARRFPDWTTGFAGRTSWLSQAMPGNKLTKRNLLTGEHVRGPIPVDWVSGACMLVRRTALEQVGGLDEGFFLYWEDADLCRRLSGCGWRIDYNPEVTVVHSGGRSSRHASKRSLIAFHRSAYRYYWKHCSAKGRLLAPLVLLLLQGRLALKLLARRAEQARTS